MLCLASSFIAEIDLRKHSHEPVHIVVDEMINHTADDQIDPRFRKLHDLDPVALKVVGN